MSVVLLLLVLFLLADQVGLVVIGHFGKNLLTMSLLLFPVSVVLENALKLITQMTGLI